MIEFTGYVVRYGGGCRGFFYGWFSFDGAGLGYLRAARVHLFDIHVYVVLSVVKTLSVTKMQRTSMY